MHEHNWFGHFSKRAARAAAHAGAFLAACVLIVAWLLTGPLFGFGDTWQLVINTATTIITFLMVFLIQNTQARDTEALHLKVNELIRAVRPANNALMDLEELNEQELHAMVGQYAKRAQRARRAQKGLGGRAALGAPDRRVRARGAKASGRPARPRRPALASANLRAR